MELFGCILITSCIIIQNYLKHGKYPICHSNIRWKIILLSTEFGMDTSISLVVYGIMFNLNKVSPKLTSDFLYKAEFVFHLIRTLIYKHELNLMICKVLPEFFIFSTETFSLFEVLCSTGSLKTL